MYSNELKFYLDKHSQYHYAIFTLCRLFIAVVQVFIPVDQVNLWTRHLHKGTRLQTRRRINICWGQIQFQIFNHVSDYSDVHLTSLIPLRNIGGIRQSFLFCQTQSKNTTAETDSLEGSRINDAILASRFRRFSTGRWTETTAEKILPQTNRSIMTYVCWFGRLTCEIMIQVVRSIRRHGHINTRI